MNDPRLLLHQAGFVLCLAYVLFVTDFTCGHLANASTRKPHPWCSVAENFLQMGRVYEKKYCRTKWPSVYLLFFLVDTRKGASPHLTSPPAHHLRRITSGYANRVVTAHCTQIGIPVSSSPFIEVPGKVFSPWDTMIPTLRPEIRFCTASDVTAAELRGRIAARQRFTFRSPQGVELLR